MCPRYSLLHPIAIALLLIAPLKRSISTSGVLATVATALVFGGLDALHILGSMPAKADATLTEWLPLYSYYAGWIVPTLLVLVAATALSKGRTVNARVVTES